MSAQSWLCRVLSRFGEPPLLFCRRKTNTLPKSFLLQHRQVPAGIKYSGYYSRHPHHKSLVDSLWAVLHESHDDAIKGGVWEMDILVPSCPRLAFAHRYGSTPTAPVIPRCFRTACVQPARTTAPSHPLRETDHRRLIVAFQTHKQIQTNKTNKTTRIKHQELNTPPPDVRAAAPHESAQ